LLLGILHVQEVVVVVLWIDPDVWRHHLIRSERSNDVLYDFLLGQAKLTGASAVDVELQCRIVEILRDVSIRKNYSGIAFLQRRRGRLGRSPPTTTKGNQSLRRADRHTGAAASRLRPRQIVSGSALIQKVIPIRPTTDLGWTKCVPLNVERKL